MTLNQIINRVKTIALNHKQIRAFHYGNVNDFFDVDEGKKFAVCALQDNGATIANNVLSVTFIIFLLDLVHISEDARNNEQDVQSDMMEVAQDLFAEFDFSEYTDWRVTLDNQVQLVREEQPDYVAGVALNITIETPRVKDVCAVPNYPSIPDIVLEWGYFVSDPIAVLADLDFQFSGGMRSGLTSYFLDFTQASNENYFVIKEPVGEVQKNKWLNTSFNYGTIPDQVYRTPIILGDYRYYVSRIPVIIDSTNTIFNYYV